MARTKNTETETAPETAPAVPEYELSFEEEEVPTFTRAETEHNPFLEIVAALAADWDAEHGRSTKAKSVTVPDAALPKITRQLAAAGKTVEKSIRQKKVGVDGDRTKVTFFPVTLIVRKSKKQKEAEEKLAADAATETAPENATENLPDQEEVAS